MNASTKQVDYIKDLVDSRQFDEVIDFETLSSPEASRLIELLKGAPRKSSNLSITEVGVYKTPDSTIYRVQASRESGRLYAKRLDIDTVKFEYEAGAMKNLRPEFKMTLEEAQAFGIATGICCVCAAPLTDPRSVAIGIGPVCARGFDPAYIDGKRKSNPVATKPTFMPPAGGNCIYGGKRIGHSGGFCSADSCI
jgi:hypothetical protein